MELASEGASRELSAHGPPQRLASLSPAAHAARHVSDVAAHWRACSRLRRHGSLVVARSKPKTLVSFQPTSLTLTSAIGGLPNRHKKPDARVGTESKPHGRLQAIITLPVVVGSAAAAYSRHFLSLAPRKPPIHEGLRARAVRPPKSDISSRRRPWRAGEA